MQRQIINTPATQAMYDRFHFAQATRVGDTIWVSGQTGIDPTTMTPADGMDAQARLAFEGVKQVLEAAGSTMADIVELTTFHTDLRGDMRAFSKVKDEYLPDRYPSWTAVGVTQLAVPDLLVEIRAVAVAGSGTD
jgi:enamine deaminase RidA (YjgF/YER057c/UK114 family)